MVSDCSTELSVTDGVILTDTVILFKEHTSLFRLTVSEVPAVVGSLLLLGLSEDNTVQVGSKTE